MSKIVLSDLTSLTNEQSALGTMESNNTAIETALEKTLSRDGTSPNEMTADFDMNGNQILNLPDPVDPTDPVTLQYLEDFLDENGAVAGPAGTDGTNGTNGTNGATIYTQASAPATSGTAGSLWIDSDSTDYDVFILSGGAWVDTTMNLKGPAGTMGGPVSSTDNAVTRFDGTSGTQVQNSGVIIDDSNNMSGVVALSVTTIELGHASDTTIARSSAGVITVEGVVVALNSISLAHTAGTIELGHASDTTISRSSAGVIAVEGVNVLTTGTGIAQGLHTIFIPAAAMTARTTNGAAAGSTEMATNKNMFKTLDFDTTTQEFAQFEVWFPKSWNLGTVTFQPIWSHASTTTNFGVVWALQGVARSDDDAGDVAFGTEQTSTDTGGTTNDIYLGPTSAAITIAGSPAAGDSVQFQIKRNPSDGSDTMAIDARLHGVRLFYTVNASTDT